MGRVFIVNHIGKDMSDAVRFGTLIPLTQGNVNIFNTERLKYQLTETLDKFQFNYKEDYVLLSGSTVLNFIVGNILAKYGKVNLLIWDAKNHIYMKREVNEDVIS